MNVLWEERLDQFSTSGITNRAIHKDGTGRCQFIKAILNYPNSLHLLYEVESSHNDNKHFSVNGQLMAGLQNGYAVQFHFINIANIMPPDFMSKPYSLQQQILQEVFNKADVKVQCDCGAFYWQGVHERDAKDDNTYSPFTGQPGTGEWQARHNASGNRSGKQLCKHLWAASEQIDSDILKILKYLGSNVSSAASTEQPVDEAEEQEQPAGLPNESKQGVEKTTTINSEKAEPTVAEDIKQVTSNAEQQDLPKLDTTEVEAKKAPGEQEVQEGAEDIEPPIEELTQSKPDNVNEGTDTGDKEIQEEPLEEIKESQLFEEIYSGLYHNSKFENDELNAGKRKKSFKDVNVQGIWATDDEKTAQTYGRHQLELDMELDNPLIVDFADGHAYELPEEEQKRVYDDTLISKRKSLETTDDIVDAAAASQDDFDGVIMKNVYDGGPYGGVEDPANIYVSLDKNKVKVKGKKFIEALREELFWRGYRNDSLFQSNNVLPNDDSKVLFLATDADHAMQFSIGQTTRGGQMIFEVYDIPVDELNIYNLQSDDENIREASIKQGGTGIQYYDQEYMVELLKQKGYDGWTKLDHTVQENDDDAPGYGRVTSSTWELGLFDKNKYKPIDRLISGDDMEFSDEQLQYLLDKYKLPVFEKMVKWRDMDKYYNQDYGEMYGDQEQSQEEFYAEMEANEQKRIEKLNKDRAIQDSGQLDMFGDNTPTERQKIAKRFTHIAKSLDGYEKDGYDFEEVWKNLNDQGYTDDEIRIANQFVIGEILPDISEGWDGTAWAKFKQKLSDYMDKREDEEIGSIYESFEKVYKQSKLTESVTYAKIKEGDIAAFLDGEMLNQAEDHESDPYFHIIYSWGESGSEYARELPENQGYYGKVLSKREEGRRKYVTIQVFFKTGKPSKKEVEVPVSSIHQMRSVAQYKNLLPLSKKIFDHYQQFRNMNTYRPSNYGLLIFPDDHVEPMDDHDHMCRIDDFYRGIAEAKGDPELENKLNQFGEDELFQMAYDNGFIRIRYYEEKEICYIDLNKITKRSENRIYNFVCDMVDELAELDENWNSNKKAKLNWQHARAEDYGMSGLHIYGKDFLNYSCIIGENNGGNANTIKTTIKDIYYGKFAVSLQESLADDNFQQIYDDLTDAHGYLSGPSDETGNSDIYMELGDAVQSIKNVFEKIYDESHLQESKEKKTYAGSCKGNSIYSDATEMAQDLGYYATFDNFEDSEDSNFEEITGKQFYKICDPIHTNPEVENIMSNEVGLFLKSKDDDIYCFYSDEYDTHYFWR